MEGYALTALAAAVVAGAAYWLTMGRQTITKKEHAEYCMMAQEPVKRDITHLREGQSRLESKVDNVSEKIDKTLAVLYKMNGGSK